MLHEQDLFISSFPNKHIKTASFPFFRGSYFEMFWKKGVLKDFSKFTGKKPVLEFIFNEVADLRPATLLKQNPT